MTSVFSNLRSVGEYHAKTTYGLFNLCDAVSYTARWVQLSNVSKDIQALAKRVDSMFGFIGSALCLPLLIFSELPLLGTKLWEFSFWGEKSPKSGTQQIQKIIRIMLVCLGFAALSFLALHEYGILALSAASLALIGQTTLYTFLYEDMIGLVITCLKMGQWIDGSDQIRAKLKGSLPTPAVKDQFFYKRVCKIGYRASAAIASLATLGFFTSTIGGVGILSLLSAKVLCKAAYRYVKVQTPDEKKGI